MPLARLQLRLPTREGEETISTSWEESKTAGASVSPGRARRQNPIIVQTISDY